MREKDDMDDYLEFKDKETHDELLVTQNEQYVQFEAEDPNSTTSELILVRLDAKQVNAIKGYLDRWLLYKGLKDDPKQFIQRSPNSFPCGSEPERKTGTDWLYSTTEKQLQRSTRKKYLLKAYAVSGGGRDDIRDH